MLILLSGAPAARNHDQKSPPLTLHWQNNILTISGNHLPSNEMKILYLEAYCRPNSHTTDWSTHTVIPHKAELISINGTHTEIKLRDTLEDGAIVDHTITARTDEVDFRLVAHNPSAKAPKAHW